MLTEFFLVFWYFPLQLFVFTSNVIILFPSNVIIGFIKTYSCYTGNLFSKSVIEPEETLDLETRIGSRVKPGAHATQNPHVDCSAHGSCWLSCRHDRPIGRELSSAASGLTSP